MTWPQDAYVGQKVVTIDNSKPSYSFDGTISPVKGDIGTISNIYICHTGMIILELTEYPQPGGYLPCGGYVGRGWQVISFRPVQSTEKGVELLKAIKSSTVIEADKFDIKVRENV